jgi:DNA-binding XRE family transcriptional regulator
MQISHEFSPRSVGVNVAAIAHQRALRGWTCGELAERAGVSPQTLSNVNRTGRCSPAVLRKLAKAFAKVDPLEGVDALLAAA